MSIGRDGGGHAWASDAKSACCRAEAEKPRQLCCKKLWTSPSSMRTMQLVLTPSTPVVCRHIRIYTVFIISETDTTPQNVRPSKYHVHMVFVLVRVRCTILCLFVVSHLLCTFSQRDPRPPMELADNYLRLRRLLAHARIFRAACFRLPFSFSFCGCAVLQPFLSSARRWKSCCQQ